MEAWRCPPFEILYCLARSGFALPAFRNFSRRIKRDAYQANRKRRGWGLDRRSRVRPGQAFPSTAAAWPEGSLRGPAAIHSRWGGKFHDIHGRVGAVAGANTGHLAAFGWSSWLMGLSEKA
jgi:hypothetical protein